MKNSNEIETQVNKLMAEIEAYKQAIDDAEGALASAEAELNELLADHFEKEGIEE